MAGRAGSGERWRFSSFGYELRVTRAGALEYLERYRLEPAQDPLDARWIASDCCYVGTTIASGAMVCDGQADALHGACARFDGLSAAVDRLGPRLLLARFAASSGPSFHEARALARDALAGRGHAI